MFFRNSNSQYRAKSALAITCTWTAKSRATTIAVRVHVRRYTAQVASGWYE